MDSLGKLRLPLLLIFVVLTLGTLGYHLLYSVSLVDALYMTVITVFTVGFREVFPLDATGKLFTVFLIFTGVGSITLTASHLFQFMIEGRLLGLFKRRKMEKRIEALRNHFIICGFGRVGEEVARDCAVSGKPFIVIDHNPEALNRLAVKGHLYLPGNATNDEVLLRAGVERAKGLVAASDSDPDNVLITLSARMLNPGIFIVSRAGSLNVFDKLEKAGANRVVSPYVSSGQRMASMLLRPLVHDFLDTMAYGTNLEIQLEELELTEGADVVGKTIQESAIRKRTGVTILAVKKSDGSILTNPQISEVLQCGDRLILVGTSEQLRQANREILPSEEA